MANRAERRREGRGAAGERSGSRLPWVIGGIVALGVALVIWNVASTALDETVRRPVPVVYSSPEELIALAVGNESGNPDAAIRVVEFADFSCPSCREFFLRTKPFLDLSYIQPGLIRFTLFDFPIVDAHPNSFLAARAARCAGDQGGFWAFHDRLFQTQGEWSNLADPSDAFRGIAEGLGLNGETFSTCLASDRHAVTVSATLLLGTELGVRGTPTVMIDTGGGREVWVDDWSIENIRAILDPALAAAAPAESGQ